MIVVVKDRDMEIGYPTDVKHVAHIGLDNSSPSASAPSWVCILSLIFFFLLLAILITIFIICSFENNNDNHNNNADE